jgi:hypothetical protein
VIESAAAFHRLSQSFACPMQADLDGVDAAADDFGDLDVG